MYLSGAQKRKNKIDEQERLRKHPKLTSFVTVNKLPSEATSAAIIEEPSTNVDSQSIIPSSDVQPSTSDDSQLISPSSAEGSNEHEIIENANVDNSDRAVHALDSSRDVDPALWSISDKNLVNGPSSCQNHDVDFSKSARNYEYMDSNGIRKTTTRYVSGDVFRRVLRNGEIVKREWLLYSKSKGSLFCFVCRLLSKKESKFSASGFNDWKHNNLITRIAPSIVNAIPATIRARRKLVA